MIETKPVSVTSVNNKQQQQQQEKEEETLEKCKLRLDQSAIKMTIYEVEFDKFQNEYRKKEKLIANLDNKVKQLQQDLEQSECNLQAEKKETTQTGQNETQEKDELIMNLENEIERLQQDFEKLNFQAGLMKDETNQNELTETETELFHLQQELQQFQLNRPNRGTIKNQWKSFLANDVTRLEQSLQRLKLHNENTMMMKQNGADLKEQSKNEEKHNDKNETNH